MERRKIQLVGGLSYAISLPKTWIQRQGLSQGKTVSISPQDDGSLRVSKDEINPSSRGTITLNADDYGTAIDSIILKLYSMGYERIELFSKQPKSRFKTRVREALPHLIGVEIIHEEQQKVVLQVLLDTARVDVQQSLFRMSLLIKQMLESLLEHVDLDEIRTCEDEADRLYHLIHKLLSLSLTDATLLHTSKIENVNFIPHYMLFAKRFEVIGDNLYWLTKYLVSSRKALTLEHKRAVVDFLRGEIDRTVRFLMADFPTVFNLPAHDEITRIKSYIDLIKDEKIKEHLSYSVKLVLDNQEEVVSLSFYKKLAREKLL